MGINKKINVVYYKKNRNDTLEGSRVAILGYGSQGRAQALNLRDSGYSIVIGNLKDEYAEQAKKDGFIVSDFNLAVIDADIIFLLLPDHAHKDVYENSIKKYIKKGAMLIVAHGYSINFGDLVVKNNHDLCLLAPRMPGAPIREQYLLGHGSPAFFAVAIDHSGEALDKLLKLSDDIGFTKAGIIETTITEETEIDLFIEQYFLPNLIGSIDRAFNYLVDNGFNPEVALMELYASGEVGDLLVRAAQSGIYKVWEENASPTCRFGIMSNVDRIVPVNESFLKMKETLENIRTGVFKEILDLEAEKNYENLIEYDNTNNSSLMSATHEKINNIIRHAK
jgi:ketol-acid reductoisomerase